MPFRCKCGKTFEKVESFSLHTSACALFHQRRLSTSEALSPKNNQMSIDTDVNKERISHVRRFSAILSPIYSKGDYFFGNSVEQDSSPKSAPIIETEHRYSFMMPTALSIQNTFEGVRRRQSMSYATNAGTAAYK